jgi:hypothetical protein
LGGESFVALSEHPPEYRSLCEHIGYLSMSWATLEASLDRVILYVHHMMGGKAIEPELPRSFNRKPGYLRKVFGSRPDLAECLAEIKPILKEAVRLGDKRNRLMHSAVMDQRAGQFILMFPNRKLPFHPLEEVPINLEDIKFTALDCTVLYLKIVNFSAIPLGAVPTDFVDEMYRKITRENV